MEKNMSVTKCSTTKSERQARREEFLKSRIGNPIVEALKTANLDLSSKLDLSIRSLEESPSSLSLIISIKKRSSSSS